MTVPIDRVAVWALQQAATLPDTVVMKQVPNARNWFDILSSAASVVISIALIALAVGLIPAAWNFRKSYKKVNELLDRIYGDINPIMRHASSVADNLNYVSTAVRQDVARLQATVAAANARLDEATRLTERRVRDFNALLEVVQSEAEAAFVSTAASLRGVREGAASFRDAVELDFELDDRIEDHIEDHTVRAPIAAARSTSEETDNERIGQPPHAENDELEGERPRVRRPRGRTRGTAG
jgi:uncharacterized protein YoxC